MTDRRRNEGDTYGNTYATSVRVRRRGVTGAFCPSLLLLFLLSYLSRAGEFPFRRSRRFRAEKFSITFVHPRFAREFPFRDGFALILGNREAECSAFD